MPTEPRWITEADVAGALGLSEAMAAVEEMLDGLDAGEITTIPKAMGRWDDGSLHALGAVDARGRLAGCKTWINVSAGATASMAVFDMDTGRLRAVVEAGTLGALRTAAVAAVATKRLAPTDVPTAAVLGTGRQAFLQTAALLAARDIDEVRVWSRDVERRERFAQQAAALFGVRVVAVDSVAAATEDCRVVATITRAVEPFLHRDAVGPDTYINAMGAILPGAAELADDLIDIVGRLVVDDTAAARTVSAEVQRFERAGHAGAVEALHTVPRIPGGPTAGITVFKSVGMGASDLALAGRLLDAGVGTAFSHPVPARPRLARPHDHQEQTAP